MTDICDPHPMSGGPRTHNDILMDETARRVFYKAMIAAERIIDDGALSTEKLQALAAMAEAAANCIIGNDDEK